jgi:hypothetical protein
MYSRLIRVDDIDKGGLQAGTSNQETIDIGLLGQLRAVLLGNTATIQNTGLLGGLRGDLLLQPLTDGGVDFLCLLSSSDLAGANGPCTS